MNGAGSTGTFNTASDSFIGAQFGAVHDSEVYVVAPEDPPEREYDVGRNYLDHGVPRMARHHIERAQSRGYDGPEVRFHLVLAILSKRSYRDVPPEQRDQLHASAMHSVSHPSSGDRSADSEGLAAAQWQRALDAVFALVSCVDGSEGDAETAIKQVKALPDRHQDPILRHLSLVLTGGMRAQLWRRICASAKQAQPANQRRERVWSYFQPDPADARAREPEPNPADEWALLLRALLLSTAVALPATAIGMSAVAYGGLLPVLCCLAAAGAGAVAAHDAAFWFHQNRRRAAARRRYGLEWRLSDAPDSDLAKHVDRALGYYFFKYAPDPDEQSAWLGAAKGIRRALRDEILQIYEEAEIREGKVNWLARFMARDVARQSADGRPPRPADMFPVPRALRVRCGAAGAAGGTAAIAAAGFALWANPLLTVPALLALVVAARFGVPLGLLLYSRRRGFREESRERAEVLAAREGEQQRWQGKLDALRPDEEEMERWLDADKMLILDEALRYYQLGWHDIIAHTIMPTPAEGHRSANTQGGPLRYSRYEVRVFLVTDEGVREATAVLNFERAYWRRSERNHYRFDAISSVQVEMASEYRYTLHVTLTNGPSKSIVVSEGAAQRVSDEQVPEGGDAQSDSASSGKDAASKRQGPYRRKGAGKARVPAASRSGGSGSRRSSSDTSGATASDAESSEEEPTEEPAALSLEVAGFLHTLRILEGIAAEGKTWFDRSIDSAPPGSSAPPSAA